MPVEYRLYKLWRDHGSVGRIYIAGDPGQAIYSFRGGVPYYFENTDADETTVLNESRRCKQNIAVIGNALLAAHPDTDPRGFNSHEAGGVVRWQSFHYSHDFHDERTSRQV